MRKHIEHRKNNQDKMTRLWCQSKAHGMNLVTPLCVQVQLRFRVELSYRLAVDTGVL